MSCDVSILRVILLTKDLMNMVYIMVPVLLIILISVDLGKIVIGNPDDTPKVIKTVTRRVIAGVAVFFVPLIVSVLLDLISYDDPKSALACWEYATPEIVEVKMKEQEARDKAIKEQRDKEYQEKREQKEQERKDKLAREAKENGESSSNSGTSSAVNIGKSSSLTPYVNGKQQALSKGDCMSTSDACACPAIGNLSGFYFTMATETGRDMNWVKRNTDEEMVTVKVKCSDGTSISKTVNEKVKLNFQRAFERTCILKTTGMNGVKIDPDYLDIRGTLVERTTSSRKTCSMHAYGAAIDINYNTTFTIDGVKYKPYSGQGTSTRNNYDKFVSALNGESDPLNVNYILWKYAFEPAGFEWGGNWSDGYFDPMHFEVKG